MTQLCIVEGSDGHSISGILTKRGFGFPKGFNREQFESHFYKKAGSVDRIPILLKAALENQNLNNIGVVVDANLVGVKSRYKILTDVISNYDPDIEIPELEESGVIITDSTGRKIGIWIMPDNKSEGYLEHFLEKLVPTDSRDRYASIKTSVKSHNEGNDNLIPEKSIQKANIYAYLALQEQPGKPPGQAISANYFDASLESADAFVFWVKATFQF